MKKVLIITYYWPPSGGAGVQRWVRFVKHLRKFGWEPIIYTADNPTYPVYDKELIKEIPEGVVTWKQKVPEPNSWIKKIYFWKSDIKKVIYKNQHEPNPDDKLSLKSILWWIRGNFFIPDARLFWIKPSVKYLENQLRSNKVDAIVSTGPPHSLHLIAHKLKKKLDIPWIADFRDPWTSMSYLHNVSLTKYAENKHNQLEKMVLESADKSIVVGKAMSSEFLKKYNVKTEIIHNGFNTNPDIPTSIDLDKKFTILHVGSFLPKRNCDDLWEVLSKLTQRDKTFAKNLEIKLIGKVAPNVFESINKFGLKEHLNHVEYIEYKKTISHLSSCQTLLLPIDRIRNAEFVITGKIFEYLNVKRPILLIGPEKGDAKSIIEDCNAGYCCDFDDQNEIEKSLLTMYNLYLENANVINSINVNSFSGEKLTEKLSKVLKSTI